MSSQTRHKRKIEGLIEKRELLDEGGIRRVLEQITRNILADWPDPKNLLLVGIRTGGVHIAERLGHMLREQAAVDIPGGVMDITLYRDDAFVGLPRPEVGPTHLPCALEGRVVILVDDVLFTGRTARAALVELIDFGRPDRVQLAVLVDRGHRELPIQANFVGLTIESARDELVYVHLHELGEPDRVVLYGRTDA